jgi:restriction system protein
MSPTPAESGTRLVEQRTNLHGVVTWYKIEVFHHGLNEVRTVGDRDYDVVERKAQALLAKMQNRWTRVRAQDDARQQKQTGKEDAESRTAAATADLESIETLLTDGLSPAAKVDWQALSDNRSFSFNDSKSYPLVDFGAANQPLHAKILDAPERPNSSAQRYHPALTFLDLIWPPSRKKKQEAATLRFDQDVAQWQAAVAQVNTKQAIAEQMFANARSAFDADRAIFEATQAATNAKVEAFRSSYMAGDPPAVARYCETLLASSKYPDFIDIDFSVGFNPDNGMTVIECELPDKDAIPTLQKVTFVASSREIKEKHISQTERDRLYDSLLYQIALRTLFEIFHNDAANLIALVTFNGWVDALNPATGQRNHGCILSLQASKEEYKTIDLRKVEPRACFRQLKGVSAARLSGMTPIRPILQLQSDDPRFVAAHAVADQLDSGYNLATMDWEEFEHLVRELFEKEFGQNGAEVRVTRASSDGGVDAVVLDPDPIRGGKIVIQAKRYTNTVGLSAVRDLYGTVINEGANRGILVSTADYGSDSYDFVKGKPLTLLSGANLLSLLAKHGHKARIDLKEAKIINALNREPPSPHSR